MEKNFAGSANYFFNKVCKKNSLNIYRDLNSGKFFLSEIKKLISGANFYEKQL